MAGKRWKEEEIKRLKELIYLDMSYKSIGRVVVIFLIIEYSIEVE